jgi:coproporphyrinogen III oxidase-like Fe-S oxidoreductase
MGIQALNDTDLKRLGRLHSMAEARAAFDIARRTFPRVSFDLIYARQDQTPEDWRAELGRRFHGGRSPVALPTDDRTRHCLRRPVRQGSLRGLPDEDAAADMYEITQEMCAAAGLPAYEVSNHARPGAESRHNLIYWRGGDWAGIGPGAHGRLTLNGRRWGTETELAPIAWLTRVEKDGSGETSRVEVAAREQAEEFLMMGLRLSEGVRLDRLRRITGTSSTRRALSRWKSLA